VTKKALGLAALLAISGTMHFARPEPFDTIVPRALPGSPRAWTLLSGAAELAVAAALAHPRTRRLGGLAAAALFTAVFPANVQMAADWRNAAPAKRAVAFGRLPFQVPLIVWAAQVARAGVHGAGLHGAGVHGAGVHGAGLHGAGLHGAGLHGAGRPPAGRPSWDAPTRRRAGQAS
jgi:uncharacterized membrane protein